MQCAIFHSGSKGGNTYHAAKIFMEEMSKCGDVSFTEFFLPSDLPVFCTGCTLCLSGKWEKCPNAKFTAPVLEAMLSADALIFTTPHYGASSMTGAMKTLLDHTDFLVLNVSPDERMFQKKAFIITTGSGSASAVKPIKASLKHKGVNLIYSRGLRMLTNKWDKMTESKQQKFKNSLRRDAVKFYNAEKRRPYISTIFFYYISIFILKKYVGKGNHPYELWEERGYFKKRPF